MSDTFFKKILNKILSLFPIPKLAPHLIEMESRMKEMAMIGETELPLLRFGIDRGPKMIGNYEVTIDEKGGINFTYKGKGGEQ